MISQIKIENFQSHKNTSLEFNSGVNVIVGSSDSGKTGILRALNWIINNKPSGDSFRSTWGGYTKAEIMVNGYCVLRIKDKNENSYKIEIKNPSEVIGVGKLEAFGQGVPEEISKIINMNEINIQYQMDAPFLLSQTPGEIAKFLNKIARIDLIDISLSKIEKRKRGIKQETKFLETQLENQEAEIKSFGYLKKYESLIIDAENMETDILHINNQIISLENIMCAIEELEEKKEQFKTLQEKESILIKAEKLNVSLSESKIQLIFIEKITCSIEKLEEKKELFKTLQEKESILIEAEKLNILLSESKTQYRELSYIEQSIELAEIEIKTFTDNIIEMEKVFKIKMPDICPLCERRL